MKHQKRSYRFFGTDGIRGRVGSFPITPDFILKLGWASGRVMARHGSGKVLIGKDTRISGYMLESALEAGLASAGLSAAFTGPMPTPAIAYLTRTFRAEAGIVISASHNFYQDNGIKFFSVKGTKLPYEIESAIEAELEQPLTCVGSDLLGRASRIIDAAGRYIEFCKNCFPRELNLNGLRVIVDCANGATYHIAPSVLSELGASVTTLCCEPNGTNINWRCGTTDTAKLQQMVVAEQADVGIAFDGDGDRLIMIDHRGNCVDGDQILYILAREKLRKNELQGGVVGTLMSNMGLELGLKKLNIPFARAAIGDRYVLEKMQEMGWVVGAEKSGHIILLDKTTTGDGMVAALQVLAATVRNGLSLNDLCSDINLFPQVVVNVPFIGSHKKLYCPLVRQVLKKIEKTLINRGRVLLRQSGTEPLARIMVEGEKQELIEQLACELADTVKAIS